MPDKPEVFREDRWPVFDHALESHINAAAWALGRRPSTLEHKRLVWAAAVATFGPGVVGSRRFILALRARGR